MPFIWSNIYGGCAFGTVDGSTLVHIEGGKLGHNIYGGGYGNIKIDLTSNETEEEEEEITRNTVLGKVDNNKEGTYAAEPGYGTARQTSTATSPPGWQYKITKRSARTLMSSRR